MFNERLVTVNDQLELIKQRENLLLQKIISNQNVNKNLNKQSKWPFESYQFCFTLKTLHQYKFLLPTALVGLEIDGQIYGPFGALLDTGAQPTLISHTLFKRLKCTTSQATKRVLGLGSSPFTIKRKMNIMIRPWFESTHCINDQACILPHESEWRPILPSQHLQVDSNVNEFKQALAQRSPNISWVIWMAPVNQ